MARRPTVNRPTLEEALARHNYHREQTAAALGIGVRSVYRLIGYYKIQAPRSDAKLDDHDRELMAELNADGMSWQEVGVKFDVAPSTAYEAVKQ